MTELRDFENDLRVMLADVADSAGEPPGLADRLVSGATRRRAPHRVRVWLGRRWVPPALAAVAVAVVAVVTVTTVSSIQAHRHIRPAHSTPAPTPTPSTPPTPSTTPTPTASTSMASPSTVATTAVSSPTSSVTPTAAEIARILSRTVEAANPSTHFGSPSARVTISDGHGGTLTAVIAGRTPAADSHGSLVFFWHNEDFVGWDSNQEAMTTRSVDATGPGTFKVTYANYGGSDPACCPSLAPVTITYRWNGSQMRPNGPVPPGVYGLNNPDAHPVTVQLLAAASPTPHTTSTPPAPSGLWTDSRLIITDHGLGAVTVGMTMTQAAHAAGFTSFETIGDGVYIPTAWSQAPAGRAGYPELFVHVSGGAAQASVSCVGANGGTSTTKQAITTSEGVRLGDPASRILAVYGSQARYVPNPQSGLSPRAGYVVSRDGYDLVFKLDQHGQQIVGIAGGLAPLTPSTCWGDPLALIAAANPSP